MRFSIAIVAALFAFSGAPVRAQVATPALVPQLADLAWLVGSTWHATLPPDAGGIAVSYDTVPDNPYAIRFVTRFYGVRGRVTNSYVGTIYYDAAAKQPMVWYLDASGNIDRGAMTVSGGSFTIDLTDPDGKFTVDVDRVNADRYNWTLYSEAGGAHKKLFGLVYDRGNLPSS